MACMSMDIVYNVYIYCYLVDINVSIFSNCITIYTSYRIMLCTDIIKINVIFQDFRWNVYEWWW